MRDNSRDCNWNGMNGMDGMDGKGFDWNLETKLEINLYQSNIILTTIQFFGLLWWVDGWWGSNILLASMWGSFWRQLSYP